MAFERLEREVHRKVFFAGNPSSLNLKSKLYLKSTTWIPPQPPAQVNLRLNLFEREIRKLFSRRTARSNFTHFQEKIFTKLRANDQIVIANADKNLGPTAVELPRYIKDALTHLTDSTTYKILPESQALDEATALRQTILDWINTHRKVLEDNAVEYIRTKLNECKDDPFGYFYLLYKLSTNFIRLL